MFLKPFRVKSNSQMKNSERKALKNKIIQKYPILTENDMEQIFTKQDLVSVSKIVTHSNDVVTVYLVRKRAMLFEYEDVLYPTVYFLWYFPDLLLCFTTHPPVVSKLISGADLMLPGVVLPEGAEGPAKYGRFEKNTLVAINTVSNKAAVAIGRTAHSNMDMYMAAGRGKCINVLHTLNDCLCHMENNNALSIPELGPPNWLNKCDISEENQPEDSNSEEIFSTESNNQPENSTETSNQPENENGEVLMNVVGELDKMSIANSIEEMDNLLSYCFLKTLKYSGKKLALPILTSNFYRLHILTACPNGKNLDIKKTSYKKLNKFLNEMKNEGIINVTEQTKGVETITSINFDHPKINAFIKDCDDVSVSELNLGNKSPALNVEENYTVTAAVLPILSDAGLRKGDAIKSSDVRKYITEYVRKKKLNSLENRNVVIPNKELADVIRTQDNVTWEELMQKIHSLMGNSYKISTASKQVSGKGKVEPIIITVASRSGNKKVTLIDNLELYGINANDFGKECQHGVAASSSVTKPVGKKCEQLLVQGNQVAFVGKLLMEKYQIPKRFIRGLELAIKTKK